MIKRDKLILQTKTLNDGRVGSNGVLREKHYGRFGGDRLCLRNGWCRGVGSS